MDCAEFSLTPSSFTRLSNSELPITESELAVLATGHRSSDEANRMPAIGIAAHVISTKMAQIQVLHDLAEGAREGGA